jgi:hypothetical protein
MASEEKTPVVVASALRATGGPSKKRVDEMATIQDDDERLLAQIGYKQV